MFYIFRAKYLNEQIYSYDYVKDEYKLIKKLEKKSYSDIRVFERKLKINEKISKKNILKFIKDIVLIVKNNDKFTDSIKALKYEDEKLMILIDEILKLYDEGFYLYECFLFYKDILPSFLIEICKISELSGDLESGLESFVENFSIEEKIEEELLKKFIKPKLLLTMLIFLLAFSFFMGVENLKSVFFIYKLKVPLLINKVFDFHYFLSNNRINILIILIFLVFFVWIFKKSKIYINFKEYCLSKLNKDLFESKILRYLKFSNSHGLEKNIENILESKLYKKAIVNDYKLEKINELEKNVLAKSFKKISVLEKIILALLLIIIVILSFSTIVSLNLFFNIS